jgi:protein-disulfide isomerase
MHDYLYEHQESLEPADLVGYAKLISLDVRRFAEELATHAHAARVREDFMSGLRSGVNGTPTFYINGVRHDGAFDLRTLLSGIQTRINSAA